MGKHIIGYLTWEDFLAEMRAEKPRTVRLQTYHHAAKGKKVPLILFWAEVAFLSRDAIHLARFPLGSEFEFALRDNPDRSERFMRLMDQAERILRAALEAEGVEVRRGVFAGTDRIRIRTDPAGLWRWEKDGDTPRLVPEAAP